MFETQTNTPTIAETLSWDRNKAKQKRDEYVWGWKMSWEEFFKKIADNNIQVEWLEDARRGYVKSNIIAWMNAWTYKVEKKEKERFINELPAEYKGSFLENTYKKLENYQGFGKTIAHWAGDMLWGFLWAGSQAGDAITNIQNKWEVIDENILKDDFVESKFKEIYGRLPDVYNVEDRANLDDIFSVVDRDPSYKEYISNTRLQEQQRDETSLSENVLDIAQGTTTMWYDIAFPWAMYTINTLANTTGWEAVLWAVGNVFEFGWRMINYLPWLSHFKDSLPEERQEEFDEFVWMIATMWLTHILARKWKIEWNIDATARGTLVPEQIIRDYKRWFQPEIDIKKLNEAEKILQPTAKDFEIGKAEQWSKWLIQVISEIGKDWLKDIEWFKDVAKKVDIKKTETFKKLEDWLKKADDTYELKPKEEVYQSALDWLLEAFGEEVWLAPELKAKRAKIVDLLRKNETTWLTLVEKQTVKQLHTQYNSLFTQAWKESAWFSSENLRAIRNVIKTDIEQGALQNGFADVVKYNTEYGNLIATKSLLEKQASKSKSQAAKIKDQSLLQKVVWWILDFPVVSQLISKPLWTAIWHLIKDKKSTTMNALQMEANIKKSLNKVKVKDLGKAERTYIENILWDPAAIDAIKDAIQRWSVEESTILKNFLETADEWYFRSKKIKEVDTTANEVKQPLEPIKPKEEIQLETKNKQTLTESLVENEKNINKANSKDIITKSSPQEALAELNKWDEITYTREFEFWKQWEEVSTVVWKKWNEVLLSNGDTINMVDYVMSNKEIKKVTNMNESIPEQKVTVKAPKNDYRSTHQIDTKNSSPITSIENKKIDSYVEEFKRQYWYPAFKSKDFNKFKNVMENPEADIKIYRASPVNELNKWDWVTIDKTYANDIKRQNWWKVYEYTVKAKELLYPNTIEWFNELPSLNKRGAFQYNK